MFNDSQKRMDGTWREGGKNEDKENDGREKESKTTIFTFKDDKRNKHIYRRSVYQYYKGTAVDNFIVAKLV